MAGGDLTNDVGRPSGVGELIRCKVLDEGNTLAGGFREVADSWVLRTGGDEGLIGLIDERDALEALSNPIPLPLSDGFERGMRGSGEVVFVSLVLLLLLLAVRAVSSVRIDDADELVVLVTSELVFFSLNPVAREAHPLTFLVVDDGVVTPLAVDEFELDTDGWLSVLLSDVIESDD